MLRRRSPLTAVLTLLAACAAPPAPPGEPVTIDLSEMFRVSDAGPRTTEISLAAPENPHQLLWGWSQPVTGPDGQPALLIERAQSALSFRAGSDPGPMVLNIDRVLERPSGPHRPPEGVRIHVNGMFVGRLAPDRGRPEIRVPETALKPGRNLLNFRIIKRPREDPARPTARSFYRRVSFHSPMPAAPEPRLTDADTLKMPAGSTASFFLRAPNGARLRAGVHGAGRLTIRTQIDGSAPRTVLTRAVTTDESLDVPLELEAGIARIDIGVETGSVELDRPRIEGTLPPSPPAAPSGTPYVRSNVLLYVVDTLRADAIHWSSGPDGPTPNLARFAEQAIVFDGTVAQSSWTRPSVASMLSGLHPPSHGVLSLTDRLGPHVRLLPETLRDVGYDTAAFVTNANVSPPFGFTRGFTTFRYLTEDPTSPSVYQPARTLDDAVLAWLDGRHSEQPFFVWAHASDPHAPYRPSDAFRERFAPADPASTVDLANPLRSVRRSSQAPSPADVRYLHALYEAEVAELDAELGRFFGALAERGILDDTIVVLVADHGEEFQDHGSFEHGNTLYQELVHVPFLVRLPKGTGTRTTALAQHVDLAPTLLSLVGIPLPDGLPGHALLGSDGRLASPQDRDVFSSTWFARTALSSLVVPPWKVILPMRGDRAPQVFDLTADPGERNDQAAAHPVLIGYARQRTAELEAAGEQAPRGGPAALDDETRERLRKLGYVIE